DVAEDSEHLLVVERDPPALAAARRIEEEDVERGPRLHREEPPRAGDDSERRGVELPRAPIDGPERRAPDLARLALDEHVRRFEPAEPPPHRGVVEREHERVDRVLGASDAEERLRVAEPRGRVLCRALEGPQVFVEHASKLAENERAPHRPNAAGSTRTRALYLEGRALQRGKGLRQVVA